MQTSLCLGSCIRNLHLVSVNISHGSDKGSPAAIMSTLLGSPALVRRRSSGEGASPQRRAAAGRAALLANEKAALSRWYKTSCRDLRSRGYKTETSDLEGIKPVRKFDAPLLHCSHIEKLVQCMLKSHLHGVNGVDRALINFA